jgi:hypothetical protein
MGRINCRGTRPSLLFDVIARPAIRLLEAA